MAAGMIGERWRWLVVAFLTGCLIIGLAREALADDATLPGVAANSVEPAAIADHRIRSLSGLDAVAGTFEQHIFDHHGNEVAFSRGDFAVLRPHFLRWAVREPGEQLLVSDGEFLWQYDLDLETLYRQPITDDQTSPLRLLLATKASLAEDYAITTTEHGLTLQPKAESPVFQQVTLRFDRDILTGMALLDNLGQRIEVDLLIDPERMPSAADFRFDVPPGVDIVQRGS
ncbi:MAG: outer membrane lipoprotein chaperone LolA [Cyanobacteriota bacterium]|nr:outer membrane lipoprotein chaperone LolA [Cyanobacteriota bacterium]